MAIEKVKRANSKAKRKPVEEVEPAPNLEEKRQQFQRAVHGEKVDLTTTAKSKKAKKDGLSKRAVIAIICGFVVLLGLACAALAYAWYQSPDKIVMDAFANAASVKSATYQGKVYLLDSTKPQITYSGAMGNGLSKFDVAVSMPLGGALSQLNASVAGSKTSMYLKIDKASQLIGETAPLAVRQILQPYLPALHTQIDDKWLQVSPNDIDTYESVTHVSQCVADIFQAFTTDQSSAQAVASMYAQYPFFKISEQAQSTDASGVYQLTLDADQYEKFKQRLYSSDFYASLAACNTKADDVSASTLQGMGIQLTIDKPSRQITELDITQGNSLRMMLQPAMNAPTDIKLPQNTARASDIQNNIFEDSIKKIFQNLH